MNLVDTATGEVIEFDKAAAERRAERITLRLDTIAENYARVLPMIREAIEKRDDLALGYRSPGEYVADRFGQALAGLGMDVRRAVVGELTEAGMSTRAIAPVVGVSDRHVRRDVEAIRGGTHVPPDPDPVPDSSGLGADPQGEDAPEPASESPTVEPASPRPAVVGIDGKSYTRPSPVPTPKFERSPEQRNAEENSQSLASSLIFLLAFQHTNQRDHARIEWKAGREAVAPTNREYVTPNHMRAAAHGLLDLADEWENTHE